ncbi:TPA: DUF1643 domain-containing protein [Clostridium perfringens]|nr:DUF1643 domain-containing protein [Clostridium perfringens]
METKESVIKSTVFYETYGQKKYRYALSRVWGDDPKRGMASVVMFNPSYADELKYDISSMKVINYLIDKHEYNGVNILNLYPIIETDSTEVTKENKKAKQTENDFIIKKKFNESKDIYVAWGAEKDNKMRIEKVKELMKKCGKLSYYELLDSKGKAVHPSRCKIVSDKAVKL